RGVQSPKVVDGPRQAFLQGDAGLPAQQGPGPPDVRLTDLRVVLGQRQVGDLAGAAGEISNGFGELQDAHFLRVADVDRIVLAVRMEQSPDSLDQVVDVTEGSSL